MKVKVGHLVYSLLLALLLREKLARLGIFMTNLFNDPKLLSLPAKVRVSVIWCYTVSSSTRMCVSRIQIKSTCTMSVVYSAINRILEQNISRDRLSIIEPAYVFVIFFSFFFVSVAQDYNVSLIISASFL